jgi:hypothetical protein
MRSILPIVVFSLFLLMGCISKFPEESEHTGDIKIAGHAFFWSGEAEVELGVSIYLVEEINYTLRLLINNTGPNDVSDVQVSVIGFSNARASPGQILSLQAQSVSIPISLLDDPTYTGPMDRVCVELSWTQAGSRITESYWFDIELAEAGYIGS